MSDNKLIPGTYRHFKGGLYKLLFIGMNSETLAEEVIYKSLDDDQLWTRPASRWSEEVLLDDGSHSVRFRLLDGLDLVKDELARQVRKGYDQQHDARHIEGSLALAALACLSSYCWRSPKNSVKPPDCPWPWRDGDNRKKYSRIRLLSVGAAFLVAEINRLINLGEVP